MSIAQLIEIGIVLMAAGAGATFLLTTVIPTHVLQCGQKHGRFAGLSASDCGNDAGKQPEADHSAQNTPARPSTRRARTSAARAARASTAT